MATFVLCSVFLLAMIAHSDGSYCICKDGLSEGVYQRDIDYACGAGADCSPIQKNGACFNPNSLKDHCNYAVNSFFQKKGQASGTCDFSGTATATQALPSQQNSACVYASSASPVGNSTPTAPTSTPASPATGTTTPPTPATGTTTPPSPAAGTTTPSTPATGTTTPSTPATGTTTPSTPATGTTTPLTPATGTTTPTTPTTGNTTPATPTTTPTGATTGSPPSAVFGMGPSSTTPTTDDSKARSNGSSLWAFTVTLLLFSRPFLL